MEADLKGALRTIEETFGERLRHDEDDEASGREGYREEAGVYVLPRNAEEVQFLVDVAERHRVPLVAVGAGTTRGGRPGGKGHIQVRFDLMRGLIVRGGDEMWVRAEPGASWSQLDDSLAPHGWSLAVYPTSAPRATVGGWLSEDGIGVGSYQYGRTRENVPSADVALPGGRRTVHGEELGPVLDESGGRGIVVAATLRTRRADHDVPFALAFDSPEDVATAVDDLRGAGTPLWHLSFLNGAMSRARGLRDSYLLFGAYPGTEGMEEALGEAATARGGSLLPRAEAYRVWGQRLFPVAPARPTPVPADRRYISAAEVTGILKSRQENAVQGTVSRSGQILILDLGSIGEGTEHQEEDER